MTEVTVGAATKVNWSAGTGGRGAARRGDGDVDGARRCAGEVAVIWVAETTVKLEAAVRAEGDRGGAGEAGAGDGDRGATGGRARVGCDRGDRRSGDDR